MIKQILFGLAVIGACCISAAEIMGNNYYVELKYGEGLLFYHSLWNVSTTSRIVAVDDAWTQHYFYDRKTDGKIVNYEEDGKQVFNYDVTGNYPFKLEDFKTTVDGDVLTVELAGTLDKEYAPGKIEYTAMVMPENYLKDATFKAFLPDGSVVEGDFNEKKAHNTELIPPFKKLEIYSGFNRATLTVECLSGELLRANEQRGNPWFEGHYGIRFGCNIPLEPGKKITHKYQITCKLQESDQAEDSVIRPVGYDECKNIYQDDADRLSTPYPVSIEPEKYTALSGEFSFSSPKNINITASNIDNEQLKQAISRIFTSEKLPLGEITFNQANSNAPIQVIISEPGKTDNSEAYTLKITDSNITVNAYSAPGAFYAFQSLRPMLTQQTLPAAEIYDAPDLAYRGIMVYSAHNAVDFNKKLIDDIFAPMRINNLVIEVSAVHWDTLPEVRDPKGMTKAELKELLAYAKANYINVTPCVSTLGHVRWLFYNGQNLDLAEDPENPYAYFIGNPRLYPLMTKLMEEVLETFDHPKYLHVGHDEWTLSGRYPFREETKKLDRKEVFYSDTMFYYDLAKKHNAELMIWQDMLTSLEESPQIGAGGPPYNIMECRKTFPKDIVMAVWRYDEGFDTQYKDVENLAAEGFPVIGCGWDRPGNIETLTAGCKANNALGYLQTTWAGFAPDLTALKANYEQYAAYLTAGVFAWNTANPPIKAADAFRQIWFRNSENPVASGKIVKMPESGKAEESLLSHDFYSGYADGIYFANTTGKTVKLKSRRQPDSPRQVTLNLNTKVNKLHLLNTTLTDHTEVGKICDYTLVYDDGSSYTVTVQAPADVAPLDSKAALLNAGVNVTPDGSEVLRHYTLVNPQPDKMVKSLIINNKWRFLPYELVAITIE